MKRKKLRVILIFSSVLLISMIAILFLNRGNQEKQETKEPELKKNGERWIQIVRTSETEPEDFYLYNNGDLSGWLEVKLIVAKEGLYIATYMGKIHRNRLDF
ncbi:hypothetical protein [uncultured Vagococcus sp.]|uniref:hypothetical protein n=1 Tax=uncultured Vagococcus sp. TaxID=189676 RepID=UPI0028D5A198|nr:hypothetical protein [uncultured Vagococcus sp.]